MFKRPPSSTLFHTEHIMQNEAVNIKIHLEDGFFFPVEVIILAQAFRLQGVEQ